MSSKISTTSLYIARGFIYQAIDYRKSKALLNDEMLEHFQNAETEIQTEIDFREKKIYEATKKMDFSYLA
ncbi:MAG TPA: hypothetical protein VF721_01305 [Pyrinomonadaceae bacterium]|jgi:hypothetical protein